MSRIKNMSFFKNLLLSFCISIVSILIGFVIYAVILAKTNIKEDSIGIVIACIYGISVLIGSLLFSRNVARRGILNGILLGMLVYISIYLISSVIYGNFSLNFFGFLILLFCLGMGGIGGIIGVNFKK